MVAASQQLPPLRMTEAEYLDFEAGSEIKHEFVNGEVFAMTGASLKHNVICMNTGASLNNQLSDKDCIVSTSDTRVKVPSRASYRYPDLAIICGEPRLVNDQADTVSNPIVLIEVLSPSIALVDHNQKLDEYIQIDSLQEYIIISQNEVKVERYLRQDPGDWLYTQVTGLENQIDLPSIGCKLLLAEIYRKALPTG